MFCDDNKLTVLFDIDIDFLQANARATELEKYCEQYMIDASLGK